MSTPEVRRDVVVAAPRAEVWRALTDPASLSAWFGATAEHLDPRPGGRVRLRWSDGVTREAVIEVVDPERYLIWRWLPFERGRDEVTRARPSTQVRITLDECGPGTRVVVVESGPGAGALGYARAAR